MANKLILEDCLLMTSKKNIALSMIDTPICVVRDIKDSITGFFRADADYRFDSTLMRKKFAFENGHSILRRVASRLIYV